MYTHEYKIHSCTEPVHKTRQFFIRYVITNKIKPIPKMSLKNLKNVPTFLQSRNDTTDKQATIVARTSGQNLPQHSPRVFFSTITQAPKKEKDNEKNPSSWKQLLALRLFIFFGVLIFLLFSYLLSESFNMYKVYTQIIKFFNDENNGDKILLWIKTCWREYIRIWDIRQWTISIVGLIPGYWYLFDVLFRVGIIDKRFTPSQKVFFISTDLFLNFVVGLVYMGFPDTIIGDLMYQCPVALSPYFIVIELTLYLLYRLWLKYKSKMVK